MEKCNNNNKIHNLHLKRNSNRLQKKLETIHFFLPSDQPSGDLEVENAWVYTHCGSPKKNKDMFFTPMGGSPSISIMVYAQFGGSPKLNRNIR